MTFLNPAILWGLFAVSIPILIHIFNLKKTRKIEISTLMFLKEIQDTKQKRIKLKQLLILLCRIAFIILAVMAFASPFTKGFLGSLTDKAPASVVIFIDNSFSMHGRNTKGTDFESAKEKAKELITTLDPADEIFLIPVSESDNTQYQAPLKDHNSLNDSIASIKISDTRKSISGILYRAKNILAGAKYPDKEIYIITDGQGSMFDKNNFGGDNLIDENTHLNIILTSSRTPNNVSIDSIDIKTKIFSPNRIVKLKAFINNHNNFNITSRSVVFTSGSYRDEKIIDLPAGTKTEIEFSFNPMKTGFQSGIVELTGGEAADDEFQNDNKRYIVFNVPAELKVLLVSPSSDDFKFIDIALSSSEAVSADSTGRTINFYRTKRTSSISGEKADDYNTIVIANRISFSGEEAVKLKEYINNGGGIIIYPSINADINNYNEVLNKSFGIPYIPQKQQTSGKIIFEKIDYGHPVFEGMFNNRKDESVKDSPEISSMINPQPGNNSQSLIKLNNGQNFLIHYRIGSGNLLFYAIPADMSASDYPAKNIFAPLTIRSIGFAAKIPVPKEAIAGREYLLDPGELIKTNDTDSISINTSGRLIKLLSINKSGLINLDGITKNSGVYSVKNKSSILFEFPVNVEIEESVPMRIRSTDIAQLTKELYNVQVNVIDEQGKISETIREARSGQAIWQYFLIGALLFLAFEFWLAKSQLKR